MLRQVDYLDTMKILQGAAEVGNAATTVMVRKIQTLCNCFLPTKKNTKMFGFPRLVDCTSEEMEQMRTSFFSKGVVSKGVVVSFLTNF